MKNILLLLSLSVLCRVPACAQDYDPQYIEILPSTYTVRPYFSIEAGRWGVVGDNSDSEIRYKSAEVQKAGLSFSKGGLSAGYGLALKHGLDPKDESLYGHSDAFNFFTHYYGREYGVDFSYSHNKGFYIDNPEEVGIATPGGVMPQFPDMESRFISLSVIQVFNPREFSLNAPFDQGERQKRGAGTMFLLTSAYYGRLHSPTPIIPSQINTRYNDLKGLTETSFFGFSVAPGWAYTFVPVRNCYITGAAAVGLGGQHQVLYTSSGRDAHFALAANVQFRLALGWTGENVFAGFYGIGDIFSAPGKSSGQNSVLTQNQLFVGFNF